MRNKFTDLVFSFGATSIFFIATLINGSITFASPKESSVRQSEKQAIEVFFNKSTMNFDVGLSMNAITALGPKSSEAHIVSQYCPSIDLGLEGPLDENSSLFFGLKSKRVNTNLIETSVISNEFIARYDRSFDDFHVVPGLSFEDAYLIRTPYTLSTSGETSSIKKLNIGLSYDSGTYRDIQFKPSVSYSLLIEGGMFDSYSKYELALDLRKKVRGVHLNTKIYYGVEDKTSPGFSDQVISDGLLVGLDFPLK